MFLFLVSIKLGQVQKEFQAGESSQSKWWPISEPLTMAVQPDRTIGAGINVRCVDTND